MKFGFCGEKVDHVTIFLKKRKAKSLRTPTIIKKIANTTAIW